MVCRVWRGAIEGLLKVKDIGALLTVECMKLQSAQSSTKLFP